MAIFKHPAAQSGLSWRAGVVFDADDGAGMASGFSGPEMDPSVTNEDVQSALNAQGFDATMDKAVSAALRVSLFEGLHDMSVNWRKGINSNGQVNGDVVGDPSTVDTSAMGHNSPASNLGEAADLFAGDGAGGDILFGENLKKRVSNEEFLNNRNSSADNLLHRQRLLNIYGKLDNGGAHGDDAPLNAGALTADDWNYVSDLIGQYQYDIDTRDNPIAGGTLNALKTLDKESASGSFDVQEFMRIMPKVMGDDNWLPFSVQDRDFGELTDELGGQLSRDFSFTGDFLDGAFDSHLTEGGKEAEGVFDFYEAGAAADTRQNYGFNSEFNRALVADDRFSGFTEDFGNMRLQNWLDDNDKRGDFDAFQAEYNAGPSIPGDSGGDVYNGDGTGSTGAYGDDAHGTDLGTFLGTGDGQSLADLLGLNFNIDIPEIDFSFLDESLSSELPEVARGTQLDREAGVNDLDEMRKRLLGGVRRPTSRVNDVTTGNGLQFL